MYSRKKMLGTEIAVRTIGDRRSPPSADLTAGRTGVRGSYAPLMWGAVPLKQITFPKRATTPRVVTISPIVWRERCFLCGESYDREYAEEGCCCGRCCRSCIANLAGY